MLHRNAVSFTLRVSIICVSIFLVSSAASPIMTIQHQAFARCPNGTHKSPSGDCEAVVSHEGLSRCPNGFHRSPGGNCEEVRSSPSEDDTSSGPTNNDQTDNPVPDLASTAPTSSSSAPTSSDQCDQSLWDHVYNPSRLQVVDYCRSVSGVIESIRTERDGDFHIRVKLDPEFSDMINSANIKNQFGDLVVEPICVNPVTQPSAISACQDFHQNIEVPPISTHVELTGSYVLDKEHGNWAEIHPVTSITTIP
jgi:hypothetical protein